MPQGPKRDQEEVEAFRIAAHRSVAIQEYDGTLANAQRFAGQSALAWNRVPQPARDQIVRLWDKHVGAPFVWLLKDRQDWGGRGWGATSPDGTTLFVVDAVAAALPNQHLEALLTHEFGHFLFIAAGDEHHCTSAAPDRLLRCEKLVWDVTATWGIDTTEAEFWMYRHFIDDAKELRPRDTPLPVESARKEFDDTRRPLLEKASAFEFPAKYYQFQGN